MKLFKKEVMTDVNHYTVYIAKAAIENVGIKTWVTSKLCKFGTGGKLTNTYVLHLYVKKRNYEQAIKIIEEI